MPSLAEVVGSVLSASTAAQHLANETSAQLAPIYREHEILRHYPLPNVALQEIELELKFAFAEDALLTGPPTAPPVEPEGRAGGAAQAGRPSGSALT
ncbi:MAG TPA: hypothetical protein VLQ45_21280, partial [Thermoanaerobaculia bacterium]|nr:hypothetical protein [Thermoanaerobaculia bacterium]